MGHRTDQRDVDIGEKPWCFETGDRVRFSPVILGGTAYLGSKDSNLYAVAASSERKGTGVGAYWSIGTDASPLSSAARSAVSNSSNIIESATVAVDGGRILDEEFDLLTDLLETIGEGESQADPLYTDLEEIEAGIRELYAYEDYLQQLEDVQDGSARLEIVQEGPGTRSIENSFQTVQGDLEELRLELKHIRRDSTGEVVSEKVTDLIDRLCTRESELADYLKRWENEYEGEFNVALRKGATDPALDLGLSADDQGSDSNKGEPNTERTEAATAEGIPDTPDIPSPDLDDVSSPPRRTVSHDRLTIESTVNGGGQAVVKKAQIPGGDPDVVALREPVRSGTLTEEAAEEFHSQAETWATIDARERQKRRWNGYEHIVGVVDHGSRPVPWIAMEYMDGGDLGELIEEHPDGLPIAQALWLGECICKGLEIAHQLGVAHLDLKPGNVLLKETDGWPWPKLADWGLARTLAEETGTMESLSVEYAAPEQFDADEFGDPDQLTDIYQAGTLLYALLTGSPPTTGSQLEIMQAVMGEDLVAPPSTRREGIPPAVDAAVSVALRRDKTERYRSVTDFVDALAALRTGEPLPSRIASQLEDGQVTGPSPEAVGSSEGGDSNARDEERMEAVDTDTVRDTEEYSDLKERFRHQHANVAQAEKELFREFGRLSPEMYDVLPDDTVEQAKRVLDRLYELDDALLRLDAGTMSRKSRDHRSDIYFELIEIENHLMHLDFVIMQVMQRYTNEPDSGESDPWERIRAAIEEKRSYVEEHRRSLAD